MITDTDVKASESEDVKVEDIGGLGKSKGAMDFPKSRARAARTAMNKELYQDLPKSWKGGGDYFFEQQEDGSLKITGGDKRTEGLRGGKSVTVTDRMKIADIVRAARGGDMLEADVTYKAKDVIETRGRGEFDSPEEYATSLRTKLETSTPEAEGAPRVYDSEEEVEGVSDLKETSGALRPTREYRNPTLEATNYLRKEMERRPDLKEVLQKAIDALGVDVESAERVDAPRDESTKGA